MQEQKSDEQLIKEIYFDPKQGLTNAKSIWQKLEKKIPLKKVKEIVSKFTTEQIYNQSQQPEKQIPIASTLQVYQFDITFYNLYKKQNDGYEMILTGININSRFAFGIPIKKKSASEVVEALKMVFNTLEKQGKRMEVFQSDKGKEFNNKYVIELLEQKKIEYQFFDKAISPNATMKIERFNRTLRDRISKYLIAYKTHRWIDKIDDIVYGYNHTEHSVTQKEPEKAQMENFLDINSIQKKSDVLQINNDMFQIGQKVRLLKDKKLFKKGSKSHTKNIYEIVSKEQNHYTVKKISDGTEKIAYPYQMLIVENDIIQNPYQLNNIEVSKQQLQNQQKHQRRLKREGII